jgi:3-hydroxyisobutyrate dehydrogenase-like beta-hydroxyacid dehydrogenase
VSGDKAACAEIRPMLERMTGKVVWMGEAPERAASFKLFGAAFDIRRSDLQAKRF